MVHDFCTKQKAASSAQGQLVDSASRGGRFVNGGLAHH